MLMRPMMSKTIHCHGLIPLASSDGWSVGERKYNPTRKDNWVTTRTTWSNP